MKRIFKRGMISLVALLLLFFIGEAIFILTFDPNVYKEKIVLAMHERYGRQLTINGDIYLSLFPRIGLSVNDISLSEPIPNQKQEFVHIENMRVGVAIWPLLFNRFLVDHMSINSFSANVKRQANDHFNFNDLFADDVASANDPVSENQSSLIATDFRIDVAGIDMQNGVVHYIDEIGKVDLTLDKVAVRTGRITAKQPFDATLTAELLGQKPQANANLNVQGLLRFDPLIGLYSVQKLVLDLQGEVNNLELNDTSLRGDLDIKPSEKILIGKNVEFKMHGIGNAKSPYDTMDIKASARKFNFNGGLLSLLVGNLDFTGNATNKDKQDYVLKLKSPALDISSTEAKGEPLTGVFQFKGQESLNLNLVFDKLSGTALSLNIAQATINGKYQPSADRSLGFDFSSPTKLNLLERTFSFNGINGKFSLQDTNQPVQEAPLIGTIQGDLIKSQINFNTESIYNSNKISLKGGVLNLSEPQIHFDLAADKINLTQLLEPKKITKLKKASAKSSAVTDATGKNTTASSSDNVETSQTDGNKRMPDGKQIEAVAEHESVLSFKQDLLSRLSGVGTFNIGNVAYRNLQLNNLGATFLFGTSSTIAIKSLKADVFGGTIKLNSDFDITGQRARVDAKLENIQLEQALSQLELTPLVSGVAQVDLALSSQGGVSREKVLNSLKGKINITADKGQLRGIDVSKILLDPASMLTAQIANYDKTQFSDFDKLGVNATVEQGEVGFDKLEIVAPLWSVKAKPSQSHYHLPTDEFNLSLQTLSKKPVTLVQDGIKLQVNQLSLPVVITGGEQSIKFELNVHELNNPKVKGFLDRYQQKK